ncbi:MAG: hypothetical protein E3J72_09980 [Planctomycetota bacterium]|nr:MAG: hypothetical protein E3J72_09980 [Planctomycetota bacterium]
MEDVKPEPSRPRRWPRRILKAAAVLVVLLIIFLVGLSFFIDWYCVYTPPALPENSAILSMKIEEKDGVRRLGDCTLEKRNGLLAMYLTGRPFDIGYANAKLTENELRGLEKEFISTIKNMVPSGIKRWLLRKYVYWRNRDLPDYIDAEYLDEIHGLSVAYDDPLPEVGPPYHRLVNYHAAHDISHAVMDNPLVGCTSFAAWGNHTADGHLIVGRNFDFNAGRKFDEDKIVMFVKPENGFAFVSVAWPGMIGVVSGINEKLISVTVNAAPPDGEREIGTPVSLVIRKIMQRANCIKHAVTIIRSSAVFVSDLYLVADGKTGEAVVVEKTPKRCAVRRAAGNFIICSNHRLQFSNDESNTKMMAENTTLPRHARMEELVAENAGKITPAKAVEILRDRKIKGVAGEVLGHAAAVNPIIATHSVVIDVTDGIIWVSKSPHQLGAFVPFSVKDFTNSSAGEVIAADPILTGGSFNNYLEFRKCIEKAAALIADGKKSDAKAPLEKILPVNPNHYLPYFLLAGIEHENGNREKAKEYVRKAFDLKPAYRTERAKLERLAKILKIRLPKK